MYPEWVLKHKAKGTNISCIGGRYYLYEVGPKWNKEKGRAQKITKKYLGRITEGGLIPPKEKREKMTSPVSVKEYGTASVITELGSDIYEKLKEFFGDNCAKILFVLASLRVITPCPFKRIEEIYKHSYLSELFSGLNLSGKEISLILK